MQNFAMTNLLLTQPSKSLVFLQIIRVAAAREVLVRMSITTK